MLAYPLVRHGPPEVLRLREVPEPAAGPGEVLVRIEAVGINYAEVLSRRGQYGWAPDLPYVPGMEATGRIEVVGAGVEGRAVGEPVIVGTQHGCYAERIAVPQARALPALGRLTTEENAAFAVNFVTAWVSLMEMARLRPADRVIVTAAAGGVGTAAVQIARAHGCEVIGMAGSQEKLGLVRELGAAHAVDYRARGWTERLAGTVGERGVDVVLEVVGGEVFRRCRASLAPFGRMVVAGYASYDLRWWNPWSWWRAWRDAPGAHIRRMAEDSVGVLATHVGYLLPDKERLRRIWRELTSFAAEHDLRPVVGRVFDFEDLPEAHRFMESRASTGKLVVRHP